MQRIIDYSPTPFRLKETKANIKWSDVLENKVGGKFDFHKDNIKLEDVREILYKAQ